jgi:hypothetical protein
LRLILFWQQACVVDGFCDVNVDGVQCFSYRKRRWGLFGGESGAQQPVVDDFHDFARSLAEAPCAGQHTWTHNSARVFSLHQACYELRLYQRPPRKARPSKATLAQRMQAIPQPNIGEVALRYLTTVAPAAEHRRVARRQPDQLRRVPRLP